MQSSEVSWITVRRQNELNRSTFARESIALFLRTILFADRILIILHGRTIDRQQLYIRGLSGLFLFTYKISPNNEIIWTLSAILRSSV